MASSTATAAAATTAQPEQTQQQPLWFPARTFARIEPELYLTRHLIHGRRPGTSRSFTDFRPVTIQQGSLTPSDSGKGSATIGSSVVRAGLTVVSCGIVAGTTSTAGAGAVYPNVEIQRGGFNSAPSMEEMCVSQRVFEVLQAVNFPASNFGVRLASTTTTTTETGKIQRQDSGETVEGQELVLTAHVQVLSRGGPPFDLVWRAVMAALRDTKLPLFEVDPDDNRILTCVGNEFGPAFEFPGSSLSLGTGEIVSSTFGVAEVRPEELPSTSDGTAASQEDDQSKVVVVADLDGEIEESCIASTINIVADTTAKSKEKGYLYGISISVVGAQSLRGGDVGSGLQIQREQIKRAIQLARNRE